ncbi:MAG TPA: HNH endonuclease [Thermoanaerobaculia bacterium]|nr:HNH endonuclease [Thermoanaerobaculia bacterium]
MRGFVANTDWEWFRSVRAIAPPPGEVNFWRPGAETSFRALRPGEPFLFRLKAPRNVIAGFGFFAHYSPLPLSMAWQIFGEANGASAFTILRERLVATRSRLTMEGELGEDFRIGCILLNEPVFFDQKDWIETPADWSATTGQGKRYDLDSGEGARIWEECLLREASERPSTIREAGLASLRGEYGVPLRVRHRLGPKSFRVAVLDAYGRQCSVTGETTLPALEAAHIREFVEIQEHAVSNGILFRADIGKLFMAGYMTVTPEHRLLVSRKVAVTSTGSDEYLRLHDTPVRLPSRRKHHPLAEALWWHNEKRFLG